MTTPPKKPAAPEDPKFKKVVQHFLNTPPKPHKHKPPKLPGGKPKKERLDK